MHAHTTRICYVHVITDSTQDTKKNAANTVQKCHENCEDTISIFFLFMCMSSLSTSMSMSHLCAWYPWKPEESTGCLRTGVTDSWICLFCFV